MLRYDAYLFICILPIHDRTEPLTGHLALSIPSMSGKGEVSFTVFLLHSRRSNTIRSLSDPGFLMNSIGTMFPVLVTCHLPEAKYDLHFSAHCGHIGSGHCEGLLDDISFPRYREQKYSLDAKLSNMSLWLSHIPIPWLTIKQLHENPQTLGHFFEPL